jgi:hypothetical protein
MRLLLKALAMFAASAKGRRSIQRLRTRVDTPQNRARVSAAISGARNRRQGTGSTV